MGLSVLPCFSLRLKFKGSLNKYLKGKGTSKGNVFKTQTDGRVISIFIFFKKSIFIPKLPQLVNLCEGKAQKSLNAQF